MNPTTEPLLEIRDLRTHFTVREGVVKAVDGASFAVPPATTVCVVGESGCGKSMTARSILGLVEQPGRVVGGEILWHGRSGEGMGSEALDLASLDSRGEQMRRIRGNEIAMIFQEPMASFSPLLTIGSQFVEAVRQHLPVSKADATEIALELLARVGIPNPRQRFDSYSFQLSGGMCQRVMIAIALACSPRLLIADEPTTALDVTTQARILDLLGDIKAEREMSMLFITHDLGVVSEIADEIVVMYLGTVVERGPAAEVLGDPKHPYTQALLRSVPDVGSARGARLETIAGQVPHPSDRPAGCPFNPRCSFAVPGLCDTAPPADVELAAGRTVRCVLHDPATAGPRPITIDRRPAMNEGGLS